ncbi:YncE family protein [Streptomyces sp. NPDC020983]|uniref:YncE family protein n=1 Tax=Streptomyces sp. NPDC020983 TaxID=3365106 RepID=UPI0037AC7A3F
MTAGVLAGAALTVLPATPAVADTATPSPRILLDETNQHVYLSTEGQKTYVEVFDLDGNRVGTIDNQPSAGGMALSPDGRTLYIAHAEQGTISAVSTTTFQQSALYRTDVAPERLAFAGGRLWFSYREIYSPGDAGIGSVDVRAQTPTVTREGQWLWTDGAPNVLADPADPDKLVVTGDGGNGGLGVFDVTTSTPVLMQQNTNFSTLLFDAAVTADGRDVVVPLGNSVQYYRLSDLQPDGPPLTVPDTDTASAVAVADDGTVAVGSFSYWSVSPAGVTVTVPGESGPRRTYAPQVNGSGLAWSTDGTRLYAASGGTTSQGETDPVLNVFHDPERGDTAMGLTAPAAATSGTPFTVQGSLTSAAPFAAGQSVHVTRTEAADPDGVPLPDALVAADGTFSFTDAVTAEGAVSYRATYDGDPAHQPAQASTSLSVTADPKADTTLYLAFENRAQVGRKLKMDGRLSAAQSIPVGATVAVTRQDGTGPVPALVGTRAVAADGTFQIADVPMAAGPAVYTVTFSGDDTYNGSTVSQTVQVRP